MQFRSNLSYKSIICIYLVPERKPEKIFKFKPGGQILALVLPEEYIEYFED